jgi:hypothetical protein
MLAMYRSRHLALRSAEGTSGAFHKSAATPPDGRPSWCPNLAECCSLVNAPGGAPAWSLSPGTRRLTRSACWRDWTQTSKSCVRHLVLGLPTLSYD